MPRRLSSDTSVSALRRMASESDARLGSLSSSTNPARIADSFRARYLRTLFRSVATERGLLDVVFEDRAAPVTAPPTRGCAKPAAHSASTKVARRTVPATLAEAGIVESLRDGDPGERSADLRGFGPRQHDAVAIGDHARTPAAALGGLCDGERRPGGARRPDPAHLEAHLAPLALEPRHQRVTTREQLHLGAAQRMAAIHAHRGAEVRPAIARNRDQHARAVVRLREPRGCDLIAVRGERRSIHRAAGDLPTIGVDRHRAAPAPRLHARDHDVANLAGAPAAVG